MTVSNHVQSKLVFAVYQTAVIMPAWLLSITIALPTALLFRLDRRLLPGHCPGGYDLRGNVSGTCPECGRERQQEVSA